MTRYTVYSDIEVNIYQGKRKTFFPYSLFIPTTFHNVHISKKKYIQNKWLIGVITWSLDSSFNNQVGSA